MFKTLTGKGLHTLQEKRMARNISFTLTTEQFKIRTKTVTRRMGWAHTAHGEILCAIEKGQGLKKGKKIKKLGMIRVLSFRKEPLDAITKEDCIKEGFPHLSPDEFVKMFCKYHKCSEDQVVNRIEFEYL